MAGKDTTGIQTSGTLGSFAGVFTPSILTILGIILFLRLGLVVGSAGLERALFILLLANGISVLTSLSLSAISTNIRGKVGGVYYLISRTLGLEFGGAIGIVMFLAQSISITFCCIGHVASFPLRRHFLCWNAVVTTS
jgi:hypothetical protein